MNKKFFKRICKRRVRQRFLELDGNDTIHDFKVWPEFFEAVIAGDKTVDIRKNQGFKVGDFLLLQEWSNTEKNTPGDKCFRKSHT